MAAELMTKVGVKNFKPESLDEKFKEIIDATSDDINRQRERLGGDWTVS